MIKSLKLKHDNPVENTNKNSKNNTGVRNSKITGKNTQLEST